MRGFIAVLMMLGAVVLVGCTASSKAAAPTGVSPTDSPTPTAVPTSPKPSATPTPTQTGPLLTGHGVSPGEVPPTRSAASGPHTSDGALAFAAYFYRALDWSIATSNPYLLKQVSASTCTACSYYINDMTEIAAAGGYSSGGRIRIDNLKLVQGHHVVKAEYVVQATLSQQSQVVVTSSGAAPTTYAYSAKPGASFLYIDWGPAGWQALEIAHP